MTRSIDAQEFDLRHTLESGQFFRYTPIPNGGFEALTQGKRIILRQDGTRISFDGAPATFVRRFLGIDQDMKSIRAAIGNDAHVAAAMQTYPGLRVMRQDPWECLVGFVCSSASNIRKIQLNLRRIVEEFGDAENPARFPQPGELNDLAKLRRCSLGYRASYIHGINRIVTESWLRKLQKASYTDAKEMLVALPGIGEKIADCICLFALGHKEAFPVDVWVERVMRELYFKNKDVPHRRIREFAAKRWNDHAGWAQQYLYHWRRTR